MEKVKHYYEGEDGNRYEMHKFDKTMTMIAGEAQKAAVIQDDIEACRLYYKFVKKALGKGGASYVTEYLQGESFETIDMQLLASLYFDVSEAYQRVINERVAAREAREQSESINQLNTNREALDGFLSSASNLAELNSARIMDDIFKA